MIMGITIMEITFMPQYNRAGGNGPAAPVLAGPVFLKVKMKFNFYKKQLMNKSASVIFVLFRLIILSYNR